MVLNALLLNVSDMWASLITLKDVFEITSAINKILISLDGFMVFRHRE